MTDLKIHEGNYIDVLSELGRKTMTDELKDRIARTLGDAYGGGACDDDHKAAAAVIEELGLHAETSIDKPRMRGINPQIRYVTAWENASEAGA